MKRLKLIIVLTLIISMISCSDNKSKAANIVKTYIKAYSRGDKDLLKSVLSKELLKNYNFYCSFFNSPKFKKIKNKELKDYAIIIRKVVKARRGFKVNYDLRVSRNDVMSDSILVIKEGKNWKVAETGMFVYQ